MADSHPPPPPLMTPEKARDVARLYMALAESLEAEEVDYEARSALRKSQWWLNYANVLAQTKREDGG